MAARARVQKLLREIEALASAEDRQTVLELIEAQREMTTRRNKVDRRPASGLWLDETFPRRSWSSVITTKLQVGQPVRCEVCEYWEYQFLFMLSHRHWPSVKACAGCASWLCRK